MPDENKAFWEICPPQCAHLYDDRKSVDDLYERWANWLRWFDFRDKTVVDYGCGGAYLYDKIEPQIKRYIGLDIADRSISFAQNRLRDKPKCEFYLLPKDLRPYGADILICQQVISHFPNLEVLEDFMSNVQSSRIKELLLEIMPIQEGVGFNKDDIHRRCEVSVDYLNKHLDYTLENVMRCNQYSFTFWKKKIKEEPPMPDDKNLRTIVEFSSEAITDIEHMAIDKLGELASMVRRIIT